MRSWFGQQSREVRWIVGGGGGLIVLIVIASVALAPSGGPSISENSPCEELVKSNPVEQSDYLTSKLEDLGRTASSQEVVAYAEGFRLNCSKGYPNSTNEREFEATNSEIEEVEAEGGDLTEAIALIRQRTEEREVFGEVTEELEGH